LNWFGTIGPLGGCNPLVLMAFGLILGIALDFRLLAFFWIPVLILFPFGWELGPNNPGYLGPGG